MESIQVYDGTDSYFSMELEKFQEQLAAKDLEILKLKSDLKEKDEKIAYLEKRLKQTQYEKEQLDDFITKSIPEFSTEE
jgi:septal ring factor EnvC (AmiA/AmiB activator)